MEHWMILLLAGVGTWLAVEWFGKRKTDSEIREYFRKVAEDQIKKNDQLIKEETKKAEEAVHVARKAHEEYLVMYPDDFDGNSPKSDN